MQREENWEAALLFELPQIPEWNGKKSLQQSLLPFAKGFRCLFM